ncbi:MAG: sodium:alanine symporter family protein [Magnetococcales bacterium]|nr:sodium:alanine symporter family protein [Magnetococcales bacterium]
MTWLASFIWNPFLSLIYLEIGFLLLIVTRGLSWRGALSVRRWWPNVTSAGLDKHHIDHKSAFIAALATSIGVGNLAGVGTAIHLGGPGALFWMWMSALAGTAFRMCSAYFAIISNEKKDPRLFATPMSYMERFLPRSWAKLSMVLAGLILVKGLVTANIIQANSVAHAVTNQLGVPTLLVAVVLCFLVGVVVVGGIQSIVRFSTTIAPWMLLLYVVMGLIILLGSPLRTLEALGLVFHYAFQPYSVAGGLIGYTVMQAIQYGVSRGVFSHGSGIGIAPFLQGANTDHPARGAFLAALVPFIDTIIICSITGLVVLSVGDWREITGAYLTVSAFSTALGGIGQLVVLVSLILFAFTTMISWAHFSERCFVYLGGRNVMFYRWFFSAVTFCGPFFPVAFIWSVGDVLIGLMLIVHLVPLTYITLINLTSLRKKLSLFLD